MTEPTPDIVRGLWQHMTSHFGSHVVGKSNSSEMKAVSALLSALQIVDQDAFLHNYATTVAHTIYTPFTVGEPSDTWSLWSQTVVCVHEHEHILQYNSIGPIDFVSYYIANTAERTRIEVQAYMSSLEMDWWHYRRLPDISALAQELHAYGVSDTDIAMAHTMFLAASESITRGAIVNQATAIALDWLTLHAPELRAPG